MPTLQIIIASVREGRVGLPVAEWFIERAREHGGFAVDVADLAELNLPLMDEPNHPRLRQYTKPHTLAWSARVDAADAFVFVHPEYNYGYSAPLKNALDYLNQEWHYKPVGFVSYGGISAGTRAQTMLRSVIGGVRLTPVLEAVNISFVRERITDGCFVPNDVLEDAAVAMLNELVTLEAVLRPLRV